MAFLARRPYDNVFAQSLVDREPESIYVARDADGSLCGVLYAGSCIAFGVDVPERAATFSSVMAQTTPRMIVSPRAALERFWESVRDRMPPPAIVRASQPVYALAREGKTVAHDLRGLEIGQAGANETGELALEAARMAAGEFDMPPPNYVDRMTRARFDETVADGRVWRARREGRLVFQCYIGSVTPQTAQLQGVWSPPQARGRGDATRAFGEICARLLREHASLCLYVNDFNARAIALYERAGFERVGEFATIAF